MKTTKPVFDIWHGKTIVDRLDIFIFAATATAPKFKVFRDMNQTNVTLVNVNDNQRQSHLLPLNCVMAK